MHAVEQYGHCSELDAVLEFAQLTELAIQNSWIWPVTRRPARGRAPRNAKQKHLWMDRLPVVTGHPPNRPTTTGTFSSSFFYVPVRHQCPATWRAITPVVGATRPWGPCRALIPLFSPLLKGSDRTRRHPIFSMCKLPQRTYRTGHPIGSLPMISSSSSLRKTMERETRTCGSEIAVSRKGNSPAGGDVRAGRAAFFQRPRHSNGFESWRHGHRSISSSILSSSNELKG
jgi:hypothetical protein